MWSPCGVCRRWFTDLNEHFRCQRCKGKRFARKVPQKRAKWVRMSGVLIWDT